jgi:hypothetical protein
MWGECAISSDTVWIVKSPSAAEVSCGLAFAGVNGNSKRNCDTVYGSTCVIVWASAINSLDPERREVICRVTYPTRDNMNNV